MKAKRLATIVPLNIDPKLARSLSTVFSKRRNGREMTTDGFRHLVSKFGRNVDSDVLW